MILKRTSSATALAILVLGTAAFLNYAQSVDLIERDAARRTMQVMIASVVLDIVTEWIEARFRVRLPRRKL